MSLRSLLPVLVLSLFAASASAQARRPSSHAVAGSRYGSTERTKLLDQLRKQQRGSMIEGSVQRRALLSGARVKLPTSAVRRSRR